MIKIITASQFSHKRELTKTSAPDVSKDVRNIIADVRARGDDALREYAMKFDGIKLERLEVSQEEFDQALNIVGERYIEILTRSAENIRAFHTRQLREGFMFSPKGGVILGQRVIPLEKVGLYVPGGTASYPSSVLMNAIPAKIAGCQEIIVATPKPSNEIMAAAKIAGVTRMFRIGGAQAIAALAYGTEAVPKVDKITGPGNSYVAEAKRQVYGDVGIDMIAGPSEILIIADKNNFASHLAADMLAQAEHDRNATAILITNSRRVANNVSREIELQIEKLERQSIARESIDNNGAIIIVKSINDAVDIANEIAPEHLEICVEEPFGMMTKIRNAGSIFIGRNSPEALGDYYAGANHVLPTMGTARFSSPLSVDDFVKKSQFIYYTAGEPFLTASKDIEEFAMSEGLTAHARSVSIRRE
ncbi:MAG: histidinol dehydrogenase [Synergistaceae bacterium]|nr:histidinol dehydrogenase [Synergistaceae bacterium]